MSREADVSPAFAAGMAFAAGSAFAAGLAFAGALGARWVLVADGRGALARDVVLAFDFAVLGARMGLDEGFMVAALPFSRLGGLYATVVADTRRSADGVASLALRPQRTYLVVDDHLFGPVPNPFGP